MIIRRLRIPYFLKYNIVSHSDETKEQPSNKGFPLVSTAPPKKYLLEIGPKSVSAIMDKIFVRNCIFHMK